MQITATAQSGTGFGQRPAPLPAHRAPVAVEAQPAPRAARTPRASLMPDAGLVAHLWAMRENVGQARARRRATPQAAGQAYARAGALKDAPHQPAGRTV